MVVKTQASLNKNKESIDNGAKSFIGLGVTNQDYKPVDPSDIPTGQANNNLADEVLFKIDMVDNFDVRIQVLDNHNLDHPKRVDETVFPRPPLSWESRLTQVAFKNTSGPFSFSLGNIYTGKTIISTEKRKLFVSEKFSEIGFVLPTKRCYGLGQRNGQFQLQNGAYTLNSQFRENGIPVDDGLGGNNGNHIHPFILCQTEDKDFFGMFFVGSAPQSFEVIQFGGQDKMVLNYITIGGPIEIYTIMRGKAEEVIAKYHAMIGYSAMPPYFALGFFQGSNRYNSLTKVQKVVSDYATQGIALEGVFLTNYNQKPHQSFTVNSDTFKGLSDYVASLHNGYQHVIFGVSLAIQNNYEAFETATKYQCLVNSFINTGKNVIGILDQTEIYYIDSFNDGTQDFLNEVLPDFYMTVGAFTGLQIQDAYLPNQISGEVAQKQAEHLMRKLSSEENVGSYKPYTINKDQSEYSTWNLPYEPTADNLDSFTVPLNASQNGNKLANLFIHNVNGHRSLQRMNASWDKTTGSFLRPLIFTDSSWAGSGAYGSAILTDMHRNWENLRGLVAQVMGLSMFGMSNVMVDGCGSLGKMDEELCGRWMQVAAFFPMFRNFYNDTYLDEDGKRQQTDPSEFSAFQDFQWQVAYSGAIAQRLPFTRYIYSQLFKAHRDGRAVVRPLFFDYPTDDQAFLNIEQTFMLGDSIKVSPVLEQGKNDGDQYTVYFPQGLWYDLNDAKTVINSKGEYKQLVASSAQTNVHLKGGKIIPYQANDKSYKTTQDFQTQLRMGFKIARDEAMKYADGYILIDDGITADSYDIKEDNKQLFTFWKLRYAEKSINFWVEYGDFTYEPPADYSIHYLDKIEILQAEDLNETDFACYLGLNVSPVNLRFEYNDGTKVLTLKPTSDNPNVKFNEIGFIKFGSAKNGDQNFCDAESFKYNVDSSDITDDHKWVYNMSSTSAGMEKLVAVFEQLDDIGTINLEITSLSDYESGNTKIYRVPEKIVYDKETNFPKKEDLKKTLSDYIKVTEKPFAYSVYKDASKETTKVWSSDPNKLYFSEFFIMDSGIFNMNPDIDQPLLGMGERAGSLFYKNEKGGIHSRYTFDQANPIDDGNPPGRNMYGYQPFYAFQSSITTNDWFGVFDISSYATDYILFSGKGADQTQIHKITIGGTINKFFFIGSKPDDIIKTYSKLTGFPTVPPLWAFGWQQCRFGWVTEDDWFTVYEEYKKNDLPLDTMWADIDYMDDYKLFTISPTSYPNFADKVDEIKKDGLTFVPIMDAGVAVRENQNYKALDDGLKNNVFIKQANKKDPLTAGVWCGNAYFPDFFKPETVSWWHDMFSDLYETQKLDFDGIWLDENEATNFCNGYCKPEERPADSLRNKPFYVPGWRDLEDKALGVDGWHDSIGRYEYDVHNLFPLMQTKATAEFLISQKKRPYILTRSNFPGIQKYGHHWMGDNWSNVEYMKLSVDGIYSYNLFALPFMGSDICGFNGDAEPDLCTRWHILGSLYPFARNHNQNASTSQEPYVFNQTVPGTQPETTYLDIIRTALVNRYSFIKYYYSSFYMISLEGGSFFKPLFYEYPTDKKSFEEIEVNILLGDALKLSMDTTTLDFFNNTEKEYYFPKDRWCRILPPIVDVTKDCFDSEGDDKGYQTFETKLESYYIHLRNGYILPYQDAQKNKILRTQNLENYPTDLYILPVSDKQPMTLSKQVDAVARGYLIFDDGVSALPNPYAKFEFYMIKNEDGKTFQITVENVGELTKGDTPKKHENLGNIYIMWASKSGISDIKTAMITHAGGQTQVDVTIDATTETVMIPISNDKDSYLFWDITKIDLQ